MDLKKKMNLNKSGLMIFLGVSVLSCSNGSNSSSENTCKINLNFTSSTLSADANSKTLYFSNDMSASCYKMLHQDTASIEISVDVQAKENGKSKDIVLLAIDTPTFPNRTHSYRSEKYTLDLGTGSITTQFTSTFNDSIWNPPWQDKATTLQVAIMSPANITDSLFPTVAVTITKKG